MKFIIINGSSCSGKSAVIKNVLKKRDRLFYLSYDSVKWLFSKYSSDEHYKDVHNVMLPMTQALCEMKYDIISDSGLYREWREKLLSVPRAHGYDIIEINLDTDYDVLLKRFEERVAGALKIPEKDRRVSNISKERFKELYDIFQKEKNPSAIIFRTDKQSVEEIAENVIKLF